MSASDTSLVEEFVGEADRYLAGGRVASAMSILRTAARWSPDDFCGHFF